ncbi:MAG: Hpt domain-containing protein [Arsenophonus endosymbiont of Dermacentor nuttalli]
MRWSKYYSILIFNIVDSNALNTIFRCAHSIKGGAATFGFIQFKKPPIF